MCVCIYVYTYIYMHVYVHASHTLAPSVAVVARSPTQELLPREAERHHTRMREHHLHHLVQGFGIT